MFNEDLIDLFFNPLDWDKKSYKFNRDEKDMHPYSVNTVKDNTIIVHNVLGINKEDLKLSRKAENKVTYIVIEGKTEDSITGKEYSINSTFAVDDSQLDLTRITSTVKNGLLYIIIPNKVELPKLKDIEIKIN